ncbi:MAG: ABC transporter substrate-binding protein [Rhodocyclales bacterium RIFCSPLOWO2_02_FULL_63_24]|nr:MAG: ABC transporter substrate-binding protein [Rhodocyclales bacterium GWA2_65_19]OHC72794.1 MAG: ABC transporter substrate-binding protein [Rhodocyclales bacterium RIFCSPLOWO2_02_FULL_63_24]
MSKDFVNPLPNRNRRRWLIDSSCLAAAGLIGLTRKSQAAASKIRIGMTPAFLHDQHSLLGEWRAFMAASLRRPVEFVQRDSYRETMDLLRLEKLEFAWICDYPFLHLKDSVRLLAVPLYQGRPHYRSYLIVRKDDTRTRSMTDLAGSVFAYADPYSNTGYLSPRYEIRQAGRDPANFFGKTFFTWSHRKVVEAVASGLAQGGAVDSYIWDTLAHVEPALSARTRVVWRSPEYGFPPFVAHRSVTNADFHQMQRHLLDTSRSDAGRRLLGLLYLDGFTTGTPALYDGVARMMRAFGET